MIRPDEPDDRTETAVRVIRRWIIEQSFAAGVGHIGSALSVVDILAVLWGGVLRNPGSRRPDRDRFILAKGHAALALYSTLRWHGQLSETAFASYCKDGSALASHPSRHLDGVDLSTGSLGQGLSVACGLSYGFRLQRSPARVFVLLSDAECNEGQVWEAAMFAAHHRLGGLTTIIDQNGTQALGMTREILDLHPLADKWRAFGWEAREVDGHDHAALRQALTGCDSKRSRPQVVIARTTMGKGVDYMEGRVAWHYRNLSEGQKDRALERLEANR